MRCARKFTKPSISRGREIGLTQVARVSAGKGALGCENFGFRDQYLSGERAPLRLQEPRCLHRWPAVNQAKMSENPLDRKASTPCNILKSFPGLIWI